LAASPPVPVAPPELPAAPDLSDEPAGVQFITDMASTAAIEPRPLKSARMWGND